MSHRTSIIVGRGNSTSELNQGLPGRRVGSNSTDDNDKLLERLSREELAPKERLNRSIRPLRDDADWSRMGESASGKNWLASTSAPRGRQPLRSSIVVAVR